MPVEDRAADTWEPLFAIADLAGGDWPSRAWSAAVALAGDDDTDTSAITRLLNDLRDVFADADVLHTATILERLHRISEAPWGDFSGHPLTDREMAGLLKPCQVISRDVKMGGVTRKGYRREHLHDPWTRYLPAHSATSATSATAQVSEGGTVAGSGQQALPDVAGSGSRGLPATAAPPLARPVAEVAETPPGTWGRVETGPCARCRRPCRRYGRHGQPLCARCRAGDGLSG